MSDEEVDMMISMLDVNGDGQVSFKEFEAMVECPDPAREDFLQGDIPARASEPTVSRQKNEQTEKKRKVFSRCIQTCKMKKDDVMRMWDILRQKACTSFAQSATSFYVEYDGFCELMPVFGTTSESRCIFDLIRNGNSQVDGRELIMSFSNFVNFSSEEKCKL